MITVESGKLNIPDDERFIGFSGDDSVVTRQIAVFHRAIPGSTFTLCLRFDNGEIRRIPLDAESFGSDWRLIWTVRAEDLPDSGIVTAQIRMTDPNGGVEHTTKDYFLAEAPAAQGDDARGDYVTAEELESSIAEALSEIRSGEPYLGEDGFWYVRDRGAQEFIRTGYRGELQVDSEMSSSGHNPVENRTVKAYVDAAIQGVSAQIGDIETALSSL